MYQAALKASNSFYENHASGAMILYENLNNPSQINVLPSLQGTKRGSILNGQSTKNLPSSLGLAAPYATHQQQ